MVSDLSSFSLPVMRNVLEENMFEAGKLNSIAQIRILYPNTVMGKPSDKDVEPDIRCNSGVYHVE